MITLQRGLGLVSKVALVFAASFSLSGCIPGSLLDNGGSVLGSDAGAGSAKIAGNAIGLKLSGSGCTNGESCATVQSAVDTGLSASVAGTGTDPVTVTVSNSSKGVTGPSNVAHVTSTAADADGVKGSLYSSTSQDGKIVKQVEKLGNDDFFLLATIDSDESADGATSQASIVLAHGGTRTTAVLKGKKASFHGSKTGTATAVYRDASGNEVGTVSIVGDVDFTLNNDQFDGSITAVDVDPDINGTKVNMTGATLSGTTFSGGSVTVLDNTGQSLANLSQSGYAGGFYGTNVAGDEANYAAGVLVGTGTATAASGILGSDVALYGSFYAKNKILVPTQ